MLSPLLGGIRVYVLVLSRTYCMLAQCLKIIAKLCVLNEHKFKYMNTKHCKHFFFALHLLVKCIHLSI